MRVLFLDTSVTYGGGQEGLLTLVRALVAQGVEARVLAVRSGRLASRLETGLIPWCEWDLKSRERMGRRARTGEVVGLLVGASEIVRRLREGRTDLLHANTERAAMACAILPRSIRPPFVFHDRTLEKRAGLVRWIGRRSALVLAVSAAVAAKHVGKLGEPGARVVKEGIDLSRFSPLPPRSGRERMVFAFVGRMSREKGPHIFAKAAREALRSGLDAEFAFYGESPGEGDADLDREVIGLASGGETAERFRMGGFHEDVAAVLREVDVVVLPSLREGLGMAAIEALARGRPVIASRVGGLPEVVVDGKNGLLVEAGSAEELARAMVRLASDPVLYARLAAGAPETVRRYSVDGMTQSVISCYKEVLGCY
jgi:glycosyltransferase involved in cell wall biosynthesis